METDKKIAEAEVNLQRKLEWLNRFDTRVAFAAGFIIALLGVLTNASASIKEWHWYLYVILGATGALLFASLILVYVTQYPKTTSQNTSLIYFGTIATLKFDEFRKRAKECTSEDYLDDLLCQIHINAQILGKKFSNLKIALILLGIAIIPWLTSIFLSKIYVK